MAAIRVICAAMLCFGVMAACGGRLSGSTLADNHIPVEVLFSGTRCQSIACAPARSTPAAEWVTLPERLGALPGKSPDASLWDIEWEGVLCIFMGERPTAGYSLELAEAEARVERRIATVKVHWRAPRPGARVAQVVTAPCLIVKLSKIGLDWVRVADEQGTIRHAVAVD